MPQAAATLQAMVSGAPAAGRNRSLIYRRYNLVVLRLGAVARLSIKTDLDFFLSGRSLPAWVTGLAFVAANLGAAGLLGMAATGAQYGVAVVHLYWVAPSRRWSSWAS